MASMIDEATPPSEASGECESTPQIEAADGADESMFSEVTYSCFDVNFQDIKSVGLKGNIGRATRA